MKRIATSALMSLLVLTSPVIAQSEVTASVTWTTQALPDVRPRQVALDSDLVERFLASLPDIITMARLQEQDQARFTPRLDDTLAFIMAPYLFDQNTESAVNQLLARHDFESYAQWANVAHSIALASEAAAFKGTLDLSAQERAARREINTDPRLSPEERDAALAELKNQFEALVEFEPLPGNRDTTAPYIERLKAATAF